MTTRDTQSRTIDWFPVHQFVLPLLDEVGSWPLPGSLAWQNLTDGDPAKLAAVLDGGRRDALRNDAIGAALAEASRDISKSTDWSEVSRIIRRRSGVYIPREVA